LTNAKYEITEIEEKQENGAVLAKIKLKAEEKSIKEVLIHNLKKKMVAEEDEHKKILHINAKFVSFLKENVITPYNDDLKAYLEQKIKDEKEKRATANLTLLAILKENLENYKAEVEVFQKSVTSSTTPCTLENFESLVQELYSLPIFGKDIKQLTEDITNITCKYKPQTLLEDTVIITTGLSNPRLLSLLLKIIITLFPLFLFFFFFSFHFNYILFLELFKGS